MLRYFVAGNLWLAATLIVFLGRTFERSSPTRYSFFGLGTWLSPAEYTGLIAALVLLSIAFFWRAARNGSASAS